MKTKIFTLVALTFIGLSTANAQIGIGTTSPDASAMLEVESTEKGFLPPRMTTNQRNDINSPAVGLQIFNLDTDCIEVYFVNGGWKSIGCSDCLQAVWNFTNCSQTGRFGPSQAQCNSSYSNTNLNGNVTISTQGIQEWTVPSSGTYRITAVGAGADARQGGSGAEIQGDFSLTAGEEIWILVGQRPEPFNSDNGSGAGGSFVVRAPYNTNASILTIAGGGGGGHNNGIQVNSHGQSNNNGGSGTIGVAGGTNGNGGNGQNSSGGAGFIGNGQAGSISGTVPSSFINGGTGGISDSNQGGFGGGGHLGNSHGAGGGGYSGGGGTGSSPWHGGGGGSYNNGTNQNNTAGANTGHGYVTIQRICL